MSRKLLLHINTVRYLRLKQIIGQLKKPFVMKVIPAVPDYTGSMNTSLKTMIPALDLNCEYLARFDVEQLMHNAFMLINEKHTVEISTWKADASPLWRFNLHYFEYAIVLAAQYSDTLAYHYYDKFKELVQAWMAANPIGCSDAWHPYTISMRLPNWCICFDLFGDIFWQDKDFCNAVMQSMYKQYIVLQKRLETWQLGNHYLENLKTIVLCSLLFDEQLSFEKYISRFLREINAEVLSDGVHFELSIMYHKIILEDLVRMAYWLKQANKPQYKDILLIVQKMINAVASLENGMGKTPFFNDSGDGISKTTDSLIAAVDILFGITPAFSDMFTASGYYKLYDSNIALMFDAGKIGPDYMPGHGHCDCLSFELSVGGKPLFVNSGTYQYQGELRKYFRSTQAHNTLMIGEKEQSECWGEHRVARRITDISAEKNGQMITGTYRTYSGDKHTRTIVLADCSLSVLDSVQVSDMEEVHSFLHLAPFCSVLQNDGMLQVIAEEKVLCEIHTILCRVKVYRTGHLVHYASEFGHLDQVEVIEFYWQSDTKQHGYVVDFKGICEAEKE